MSKLSNRVLRHVYFHALPVGTAFWHKKGWYIKTDEEEAYSIGEGRRWVFEIHYGCVIHQQLATGLGLMDGDYQECCPQDVPPSTDAYFEKLFGVPLK